MYGLRCVGVLVPAEELLPQLHPASKCWKLAGRCRYILALKLHAPQTLSLRLQYKDSIYFRAFLSLSVSVSSRLNAQPRRIFHRATKVQGRTGLIYKRLKIRASEICMQKLLWSIWGLSGSLHLCRSCWCALHCELQHSYGGRLSTETSARWRTPETATNCGRFVFVSPSPSLPLSFPASLPPSLSLSLSPFMSVLFLMFYLSLCVHILP